MKYLPLFLLLTSCGPEPLDLNNRDRFLELRFDHEPGSVGICSAGRSADQAWYVYGIATTLDECIEEADRRTDEQLVWGLELRHFDLGWLKTEAIK
jgi:hypothetical protein